MNERIKELANKANEQVGYAIRLEEDNKQSLDLMEKFAELIVKECVKVIDAGKPGVVQIPAEIALDMIGKNVKAYFGVEQ